MNTIPDAAIEAAAEAIDRHDDWYGTEDGEFICDGCPTVLARKGDEFCNPHQALYDHRARAAIEAAMPAIREAIAQQIEAEYENRRVTGDKHDGGYTAGFLDGLDNAERIVRGGAA